jgi:hypothetical protein
MIERSGRCNLAVVVWWALVTFVLPASGAVVNTLHVDAANGLPGFKRADLSCYLAQQMAETALGYWRFEAAKVGPVLVRRFPDRVEWRFNLDPDAGGQVRTFGPKRHNEQAFNESRSITIEARLYLNGEYRSSVEKQVNIEGRVRNDRHLSEAIAGITQSLLGPFDAARERESVDAVLNPDCGN